jgi:S-adenosylmethionine decarboxylase
MGGSFRGRPQVIATEIHHGLHLLADFHGVDSALLCDGDSLSRLMRDAATAAGATVLGAHFHGFGNRMGVTGVVLLAESHLSVHTWPESGYAAFDIFMCGELQPRIALKLLASAMDPVRSEVQEVRRG